MDDPMPITDAELLRRYADARDEGAFAELVRRYLGLVYHAAQRQLGGEAHAAEDVTQRVFTLLARKVHSLRHHTTLAGWLHTTTRFIANEIMRTERRRRAREHEAFTMHDTTTVRPGPDNDAAWTDLRPVIDEALGELDASDREAVLLRYFADLPHAQIGARLAISENAARMRVERALEKLHSRLARRGVTSTAAALGVVLANQAGAASAVLPTGMAASVTSAALAGAAAAGATVSAAGFFGFMSTAKILGGLAVVVGVAGLGSAFHEQNHARQTEATLAALRREAEELRMRAADNDTARRSLEQKSAMRIAALEKDIEGLRKAATSGSERSAATSAKAPIELWSVPGYASLHLEKKKGSLALRYGPLYRSLNLTAEQIAVFERTLMEAEQGLVDIWSAATSQGLSVSDNSSAATSIARMTSGPLGAADEGLKALLGAEAFGKFQQFEKAREARELIAALAGSNYYTESPLTAQQGEVLAGILAANTATERIRMTDDGKKPVFSLRQVTDWDKVSAQAQGILTPSQLRSLHLLVEQRRLDREISRTVSQSRTAAEKKSGG
ncbi:MAG: sigma-70 family RNA polymerase sigma factor [Opitutaceae bacterium]|nr:sigma-70 family RNA polymerase sigma factor [Opitutaceae bacterium]